MPHGSMPSAIRMRARMAIPMTQVPQPTLLTTMSFAFSLPRGAYATTVLREFMKVPVEQRLPTGAAADDDDDDNRDGSGAGADRQQHKKQKRFWKHRKTRMHM